MGVLGTLGVQHLSQRSENADAHRTMQLFEAFPWSWSELCQASEHEALYDAHIKYQLSGRVKRVILPFGFAKGTLVFPNTTDIVIADDGAEVIAALGSSDSQRSGQPNHEMKRTRPGPGQATQPRR